MYSKSNIYTLTRCAQFSTAIAAKPKPWLRTTKQFPYPQAAKIIQVIGWMTADSCAGVDEIEMLILHEEDQQREVEGSRWP